MGYDIQLVRPRPGQAIEDIAMADEDGPPSGPRDPAKEVVKQRVAKALVAADPALKSFAFGYAEIARIRSISIEQAEREHRDVELNDETTGLQIMLSDDGAGVSVPYWHSGPEGDDVLRRMLACVRIIARETGFVAFDPQVGEVIDPDVELARMVATHARMVDHVREMKRGAARPWWKFW